MKTFKNSPRPKTSPWGKIDHATEIFPGIWQVSTPGHGGFIVSAERYAAMAPELRELNVYGGGRAYEEDCEWALVALSFPDEFRTIVHGPSGQTDLDYASQVASTYYQNGFAALTATAAQKQLDFARAL